MYFFFTFLYVTITKFKIAYMAYISDSYEINSIYLLNNAILALAQWLFGTYFYKS